jgi:hypothetical protein
MEAPSVSVTAIFVGLFYVGLFAELAHASKTDPYVNYALKTDPHLAHVAKAFCAPRAISGADDRLAHYSAGRLS